MKKTRSLFALLFFALLISGCEKDDICEANKPTTPRLIITFYDDLNPTVLKNVTNLQITGEGAAASFLFNGVSKVALPLKTIEDLTNYSLIINSTEPAIDNQDFLQFNYTRQNVFVSRACGFKTLFMLKTTNPVLKTDSSSADGFWIKNITIETSKIETENETHIKIYF